MKVANNTFVTLTYTLHNDTKDGPVIDQATKEKPLEAIFGHGMFLPRFEECLQGLEPGDKYGFHLTPAEGYGEYFGHGTGHGVGLEIHEFPSVSYMGGKVPENSVITVEPGIYLPGKFGVRIEDMALITADGSENLTKCKKELIVL